MKNVFLAALVGLTLVLALPTAALAAAPNNDNRADAETIASLPFSDTTLIHDATAEAGEPDTCESRKSIWYRYQAVRDGRLVASTGGSSVDLNVAVFEGSADAMSLETCSYTGGSGSDYALAFDVSKDHTYFVRLTPAGDTVPTTEVQFALRHQPTITTTADQRGWSNLANGRGVATGTVNCSAPVPVTLRVSMNQKVPGGSVTADKVTYLTCNGPMRWQANMKPYSGKFIDGPAKVEVYMSARSESLSSKMRRDVRVRTCSLVGTIGDDTLTGTSGNDRICGLAGDDTIDTRRGNDNVYAGPGDDVVATGAGQDFVYGDEGADRIATGSGADTVDAGSGSDIVRLGSGSDVGRNGSGRDRLYGDGGNDTLSGGSQADLLHGGTGTDRCSGGTGRDAFRSCAVKRQ